MAIQVVEFSNGGVQKLERFWPQNQLTQRKLWNFENWVNASKLTFFNEQKKRERFG